MAIQQQGFGGTVSEVDAYKRTERIAIAARGASHAAVGQTGTMAAALGANSSVFAMRPDPSAGATFKAYISRIRIEWRCIAAFTTPITEGRRLALFRGSGGAPSGATTVVPVKKDSADAASQFTVADGGIIQVSTTAALTMTGITFEADPLRVFPLEHLGAAAAREERIYEFNPSDAGGEIVLNQGEVLAWRNPAAMDAAGTWKLTVTVDWYEGLGI
jgi:hypothetical protein